MIIHPDHATALRHVGTLAGYPVYTCTMDSAHHPSYPGGGIGCGGPLPWVRIGSAPWTRADSRSARRLGDWLDQGEPIAWTDADLVDILVSCGLPEIEDQDWPGGAPPPPPYGEHHWRVVLPTAQRAAGRRYVAALRAS